MSKEVSCLAFFTECLSSNNVDENNQHKKEGRQRQILKEQNSNNKFHGNSHYEISSRVNPKEIADCTSYQRYGGSQTFNSNIFSPSYKHEGLPNIGNTCYINSILQLLYSAQELRSEIIQISQKKGRKMEMHYLLGTIFADISNQFASKQKKQDDLSSMVGFISSKQTSFTIFRQGDAIQMLLFILNRLDEEDPSKSKLDYFKIVCEYDCNCNLGKRLLIELYIFQKEEICSTCQQRYTTIIHGYGKYLIQIPNFEEFSPSKDLQLVHKNGSQVRYEMLSFIVYRGNKVSGHYKAFRRYQRNNWIQINDSLVRMVNLETEQIDPMIVLRQFQKKSYF